MKSARCRGGSQAARARGLGFRRSRICSRRKYRITSRTWREHPYASLFLMNVYVRRGSEKGAIWGGVDVASANLGASVGAAGGGARALASDYRLLTATNERHFAGE